MEKNKRQKQPVFDGLVKSPEIFYVIPLIVLFCYYYNYILCYKNLFLTFYETISI